MDDAAMAEIVERQDDPRKTDKSDKREKSKREERDEDRYKSKHKKRHRKTSRSRSTSDANNETTMPHDEEEEVNKIEETGAAGHQPRSDKKKEGRKSRSPSESSSSSSGYPKDGVMRGIARYGWSDDDDMAYGRDYKRERFTAATVKVEIKRMQQKKKRKLSDDEIRQIKGAADLAFHALNIQKKERRIQVCEETGSRDYSSSDPEEETRGLNLRLGREWGKKWINRNR